MTGGINCSSAAASGGFPQAAWRTCGSSSECNSTEVQQIAELTDTLYLDDTKGIGAAVFGPRRKQCARCVLETLAAVCGSSSCLRERLHLRISEFVSPRACVPDLASRLAAK